jgi:peptidoglycan-N-acetylglucosamine deacetylase
MKRKYAGIIFAVLIITLMVPFTMISCKQVALETTLAPESTIENTIISTTETTTTIETTTSSIKKGDNFNSIYGQIVNNGNRNLKEIALTFDADMTPFMIKELEDKKVDNYYNSKITKILTINDVKATIFITGLWAQQYKKETLDLFNDPLFEIGNHSMIHSAFESPCYQLGILKESEKENDFKSSQEILKKITGSAPKLFRFPGGCCNDEDVTLANKFGLTVIGWDLASGDAFNNNTESIIRTVKNGIQPGTIIVMHLHGGRFAPKTADALPEIISFARKKGYIFVTVGEMIGKIK